MSSVVRSGVSIAEKKFADSSLMHLIRAAISAAEDGDAVAQIVVDRLTLAKRRWRGRAEDGVEFGFDLSAPLTHGARFADPNGRIYGVEQKPEMLLEVTLIPRPAPVARLSWAIGNLHFPIAVSDEWIRVPDDPALRQLFTREKIPFTVIEAVFQPFARAHGHV